MRITIENFRYEVEEDGDDILLLSPHHDIIIPGGLADLRTQARGEYGHYDNITGEIECERYLEESFIAANLYDYIVDNYRNGYTLTY